MLGLFAKHWTPGQVKTRLAVGIGTTSAARFHRNCIDVLLERFKFIADTRVVYYWPPERGDEFTQLGNGQWQFHPQIPGDLGTRMTGYFEDCFNTGFKRVLLLGTDSPSIPLPYIERAILLLEERRLVLGPTDDGGYYLVGASCKLPPIFEAMPWSTPRLWPATLRQLEAQGWQRAVDYELLPPWYDIDTISDLKRLYRELLVKAIGNTLLTDLRCHVETALELKPAS